MNTNPTPPTRNRAHPGPTARLAVSALAAALLTSAAVVAPAAPGLFGQVPVDKGRDAGAKDAAKTKTAKKAAAAKTVEVANPANFKPASVQRLVESGRTIMHAEILLARNVCKLDHAALAKIYPECAEILDDVATQLVSGRIQVRPRVKSPDPNTVLRRGIASVFRKHLSADQYRIFETESARRDEAHKKAAVRFLVESIDVDVPLLADQRATLGRTLEKNWDENWAMYVERMYRGNCVFPSSIDEFVTPTLTEPQLVLWRAQLKGWLGVDFGVLSASTAGQDQIGELLGATAVKREPPAAGGVAAKTRVRPAVKVQTKVDDKPAAK